MREPPPTAFVGGVGVRHLRSTTGAAPAEIGCDATPLPWGRFLHRSPTR